MTKITTLRGMNDIGPSEAKKWSYVENVLKAVAHSYGYEEIRFPIVDFPDPDKPVIQKTIPFFFNIFLKYFFFQEVFV